MMFSLFLFLIPLLADTIHDSFESSSSSRVYVMFCLHVCMFCEINFVVLLL